MATIRIRLFGKFRISCGDKIISEEDNRSKKLWKLLEYIVINRNRKIPQEELAKLLSDLPDASEGSLSSLKTMLHRVRSTLDALEALDGRRMILQKSGCYYWNSLIDCAVDTDEFDRIYRRLEGSTEPDNRLFGEAIRLLDIYEGRFLDGKYPDCPWASVPRERYHAAYIRTFEYAATILLGNRQNGELLRLSERAIRIDECCEPFRYYQIRALVESGDHAGALECYERTIELFYSRLRKNPSDRLRMLYRAISKEANGIEHDLGLIGAKLSEFDRSERPTFVEYEAFRYLYRPLRRIGRASGIPYSLLLLTVHRSGRLSALPQAAHLGRAISMLRELLGEHLSPLDVCTRYSVTQYLCFVRFASEEEADRTVDAIVRDFATQCRSIQLELSATRLLAE